MKSGRKEGFASKHYFVHKEAKKEYERKPWYFGDMTREDAERLLGDTANPDGFGQFKLLLLLFLAVQNRSIGDLVPWSVGHH